MWLTDLINTVFGNRIVTTGKTVPMPTVSTSSPQGGPVDPIPAPAPVQSPAVILSTKVDRTKLYPRFAEVISKFEIQAATQVNAYLFDGFRSFDDQMTQYQKGRQMVNGQWVVVDQKQIVTKAQPGLSFHNYGVAVDMVFDGNLTKQGIQWSWDDSLPWGKLGQLGKTFGLEWAGDWVTFPEQPHLQKTYGYKIHQLYDTLTSAKTHDQGLLDCWKLFDKIY